MTMKTAPFLEGKYGWDYGESGWNEGMDQNQVKFSFMFDRNVDGIVSSLPSAVNGQAFYLTTDNRIYFAIGTTWYSTPTPKWFTFQLRSTGVTYQFNGSSAVAVPSNTSLAASVAAIQVTIGALGTAAFRDEGFFASQAALDVASSQANAYTDSSFANLSNTTDPLKGAALVGNTIVNVSNIQSLLTQKQSVNLDFWVNEFITSSGIGGGVFKWSPTTPRSSHNGFLVISPTVPFNGTDAGVMAFLQGTGETSSGSNGCFVRVFSGKVLTSWSGARPGIDSYQIVQFVIDKLLLQNLSIHAQGSHTFSAGIVMPQYRTPSAPVYKDWNRVCVEIDEIIYTGTSGVAVTAQSPLAKLVLHRAIGPGTAAGTTTCVESGGLGDPMHEIGYVSGFTDALHLNHAFGQSIDIGWLTNGIRGIRGDDSNACKIYKGRIGGGFSSSAIDPESLEVGVVWGVDCSDNHVYSNIEYCRRSSTSVGYQNFGGANFFHGYIESCSSLNLLESGRDGVSKILAGGTNVSGEQAALYAADCNEVHLSSPLDYFNETPGVGGNTDLTFQNLQSIGFGNSGNINAPRGLQSFQRRTNTYRNEILDSSVLTTASWSNTVFGSALWSNVTQAASTIGMPEWGLSPGTKFTFPAVADTASFYAKSQTITLANGPVSYGLFAYCESGEVEIFVRVLGGGKQSRQAYKLIPSSGFIRIQSRFTNNQATDTSGTYQIQFRSRIGAVVHIMGAHSINFPYVNIPVVNNSTRAVVVPGAEIEGNTLYNGLNVNGDLAMSQSPVLTTGFTVGSGNKYLRYIIGAMNGNITLPAGTKNGQIVSFKRTGDTSTGCNIIAANGIDGAGSYSLTANYSKVDLQWNSELSTWLVI